MSVTAPPFVTWFRENSARFSGQLLFEEPMAKHTYYRIGGAAAVVALPKSLEDLRWIADGLRETSAPLFVMGAGSNLLVADSGFRGVVVRANRMSLQIEPVVSNRPGEGLRIRTGGGVSISTLLRKCAQEGWGGLEFLTGIPGSVGGAVFMNAGTHLGEAKDRLRRVEAYPLIGVPAVGVHDLLRFEGDRLKYEYRKNFFLPEGAVVWSADWEIRQEDPARVKALIDETLVRRKSIQPVEWPSCGSVFKNPKEHGLAAWQVLDRLGLRGHKIGGAQISEKHSNFIVNLGEARAADIRALIQLAKTRAKDEMGIELREEVVSLGF